MEWGHPENLIWSWAVPAIAALFLLAYWRKKRELARFGDLALVARLVEALDMRARFVKRLLVLAAVASIVVALAQPHFRKKETLVERRGIDILIAVDVSNSMLAKDIAPTRLEKSKLELAELIDKLKGNRMGIIAFAGEAIIQCPLTLDRGAVKMFLSTMSPNLVSYQGTDLGRAIGTALQAFQSKEKGAKALIILTDGEDHGKETAQMLKKAKDLGVSIFAIGIGTSDGATLPDESGRGHKKDLSGRVVLSKIDETTLKKIAQETGGAYFRAVKGNLEADRIQRYVNRIETKGLRNDWSVEYEENFQFFLVLALVLLLLETGLSEGRRMNA